ncbi:MAG: ATP-binding protein [Saprospiraceae bacterium]
MSKQHQTLCLPSDPKNVSKVEPFVESVFKEYQLSPDIYGNILISLTEAVTNAIMHGNKSDTSKVVRVQTRLLQSQMAFFISDEGGGFDVDTLPDPTAPENLLKIGGRGVFLMQQLSDDVVFHDDGRTIEIKFNI